VSLWTEKRRGCSTRPHQRLGVSFRACALPKASANLNIRWNDRTYVFELLESDVPVLSLNMEAPQRRRRRRWPRARSQSAKTPGAARQSQSVSVAQAQQPESVADVGFTSYDGKPLVSDFDDYEIQIEQAFRFNARTPWSFAPASPINPMPR